MKQPFRFSDGQLAHNIEELVQLCEQFPKEAFHFLIREDFEKWLNSIGKNKLAQIAKSLRIENSEQEKKLGASQSCTLAILKGTEALVLSLLWVMILRKWDAPKKLEKFLANCRKDYQRKNWLQENKIYFETVAAVFLSVAAILVTTAQTIFIFKQARLMDIQTKVAKQQSFPQFIIRRVVFSDPNYKKYYDKHYITDEWIEITNLGGVFYNLQSSEVVILEIEYQYNLQPWKSSKTIQIPVFGYYVIEDPPKNKGQFYIKGNHNLVKFYDLQKDLRTLAGEDYAFLSKKTYLKLTYRDLLGDLHNDYYEINHSSSEGKLISLKEGKTIFDNFEILSVLSSKEYKENKRKDIPIDFATITAKKILEILQKND